MSNGKERKMMHVTDAFFFSYFLRYTSSNALLIETLQSLEMTT